MGGNEWGMGMGWGHWGELGCDKNIVALLNKGEVTISKMDARQPL